MSDSKEKRMQEMEDLGYAYYGGDETHPCDWFRARDIFLQLMEECEDAVKIGQYSNTLGYIYYYGRCNEGVPQYKEAYKYFTLGAQAGFFESSYKLSDMYMKGYFVEKNEVRAVNIIVDLYKELEEHFYAENWGSDFADVALRLSGLYENGKGCERNPHSAYFFLLMADYAIKKRIENYDFYGDRKVAKDIEKSLAELEKEVKPDFKATEIERDCPHVGPLVLSGEYDAEISFLTVGNKVKITSKRRHKANEKVNRIVMIYPEAGYVGFTDAVSEVACKVSEFTIFGKEKGKILCDEILYDKEKNRYLFYYQDSMKACIRAEKYVVSLANR